MTMTPAPDSAAIELLYAANSAVVVGRLQAPPEEWGIIDLPIIVDWPNRPLRIVDRQLGKPSLTRWRVLGHDEAGQTTRGELEPITGQSEAEKKRRHGRR